MDGLGLPGLHFWVDEKPEATKRARVEVMREVAKALVGKMYVMQFDERRHSYLKDNFHGPYDLLLGIQDSFGSNPKRYAYKGAFTAEAISKFADDYLNGLLEPSRKSEDEPEEAWEPGTLKKIVHTTLAGHMHGGPNATVIAFHKSELDDKWASRLTRLAQPLKVVPSVLIGLYNLNANHVPTDILGDEPLSSPVRLAVFLPSAAPGTPPIMYTGSKWSQRALLEFLKPHIPSVEAAWDEVWAEAKRLDEEQKALREAEAAARKAEEERIAALPKISITPDDGIIKQVIKEGDGEVPPAGSGVKAHYTGTLLDGTKFDSSRDRGQPFEFKLGQGMVIKCWDQAFATMKVGEQALLTCQSDYAYGEQGTGPIPAKATLKFDVELVGFDAPEPVEQEEDFSQDEL
mmetsp:Transcript_114348/g.198845  ORF Transcript_114348/g.198845 Transcript_114348/m.198845 type:complete len:403 (+) Transcript_114348:172-1380(+)